MACSYIRFLGRTLFAAIFILAGYQHFSNPTDGSAKYLISSVKKFEALLQHHKVAVPEQVHSSKYEHLSEQIIQGTGVVLMVAGAGIVLGFSCFSLLISLFLVLANVLIHNPFYEFDQKEHKVNCEAFTLNTALLGISLLFCCSKKNSVVTNVKKEKSKKTEQVNTDTDKENKKGQAKKENKDNKDNKEKRRKRD